MNARTIVLADELAQRYGDVGGHYAREARLARARYMKLSSNFLGCEVIQHAFKKSERRLPSEIMGTYVKRYVSRVHSHRLHQAEKKVERERARRNADAHEVMSGGLDAGERMAREFLFAQCEGAR